jgi:hypothetical protein
VRPYCSWESGAQNTGRPAMKASSSLAAFAPQTVHSTIVSPAKLRALRRVDTPKANPLSANFQGIAIDDAGLSRQFVRHRDTGQDENKGETELALIRMPILFFATMPRRDRQPDRHWPSARRCHFRRKRPQAAGFVQEARHAAAATRILLRQQLDNPLLGTGIVQTHRPLQ